MIKPIVASRDNPPRRPGRPTTPSALGANPQPQQTTNTPARDRDHGSVTTAWEIPAGSYDQGMARSSPRYPPDPPLSDGVVALRRRTASDLDAIAAASSDIESRRWLDDRPMDDDGRRTSLRRVEEAWQSGRAAPLMIADAATDEPVGLVNLQFRDDDVATIAYSVFPGNRGRGIAPRAVRLLTGWAFADLKMRQLLLEADEENAASVRVAEKCRFERLSTRTELRDGEERTVLVFSLLPGSPRVR